jgi:hypothetical protein
MRGLSRIPVLNKTNPNVCEYGYVPRDTLNLLKETFTNWRGSRIKPRCSTLVLHGILAGSLLVTVIAITGLIWARDAVEAQVLAQVRI